MYKGRERRLHLRHDASSLKITIRNITRQDDFRKADVTSALDFHQAGLSFESGRIFNNGDELEFDLNLKRENIRGIIGQICNITETGNDTFRYGVRFVFDANNYMQSTEVYDTLQNIEDSLEKETFSSKKVKHARLKKTIRKSKGQHYR